MAEEQPPKDDWLEAVLDRIEQARNAKGLSQRDLGSQIGISGSAIAQWGDREGSFVHWRRLGELADALGVSADWLLGRAAAEEVSLGVDPRAVQRLIRRLREAEKIADLIDPREPTTKE